MNQQYIKNRYAKDVDEGAESKLDEVLDEIIKVGV
jgi:hypothetical protein